MAMRSDAVGLFWEERPVIRERKEAAPPREAPEPIWLRPDYLPGLAIAKLFRPKLLTLQEFYMLPAGTELLYDVECYPNMWCVTFQDLKTLELMYFEISPWASCDMAFLRAVWENHTHTGFNNLGYDQLMVDAALHNPDYGFLYEVSSKVFEKNEFGERAYSMHQIYKLFKIKKARQSDQIDLMNVAPLRAKLKIYGGRMHTPFLESLPFVPGTVLTQDQACILRYYNMKDMVHTRFLRLGLQPQLELRVQMSNDFQEDLRSRSDAQIAETVMRKELGRILGRRIEPPVYPNGTTFYYKDPGYVKFRTPLMQRVFDTVLTTPFRVINGRVDMPQVLKDMLINIAQAKYQMGIGGLHSTESKAAHVAGGGYRILDRDVTSYYPFLILNQNLFPAHIGPQFLVVYRGIVDQRVAAKGKAKECKDAGDKKGQARWEGIAESLKIVVNGAYGKLGSEHSVLYSPENMIQTTLTGQLCLLMLIERMELCGIQVISANTDGITMKVHESKHPLYLAILADWEKETRFQTEETEYLALYSANVNNYVAVKKPSEKELAENPDAKPTVKTKGSLMANPWDNMNKIEPWLHINPTTQICKEAIHKMLTHGKSIEATIRECKDITKFTTLRTVDGGAAVVTRGDYQNRTPSEKIEFIKQAGFVESEMPGMWRDTQNPDAGELSLCSLDQAYRSAIKPTTVEYLGDSIRWYYAKGREQYEIVGAKRGSRVGSTDGAKPCMDLPQGIPDDLDYDWYIKRTEKMLKEIAFA